jgi:hypothetical protein
VRRLEFTGILQDDASLKQYWLLYDALNPLEWRIKTYHSRELANTLPMLIRHFDVVAACDDLPSLTPDARYFFQQCSNAFHLFIGDNATANILAGTNFSFKGVDEILIPVEEVESNIEVLRFGLPALHRKSPIRRIDVMVNDKNTPLGSSTKEILELGRVNGIMTNVVTKHDLPEDEWYSRPGVEELVDADPIPYREGQLSCCVTADALYHRGGFQLNLQEFPNGTPFYNGTDGLSLIAEMVFAKVDLYSGYKDAIQNKDGNIYYSYFAWVADNVKVNKNFTFIPNFMLRPTTTFYKTLVSSGRVVEVPPGLLLKGATSAIPIVEVRNA